LYDWEKSSKIMHLKKYRMDSLAVSSALYFI